MLPQPLLTFQASNPQNGQTHSQNNLQLPNRVPTHMFSFPEEYGETQKGFQVTTELLHEVSTQLGLSIDNGRTA